MSIINSIFKAIIWLMAVGFMIATATKSHTPSIEGLMYINLAIILILLSMRGKR